MNYEVYYPKPRHTCSVAATPRFSWCLYHRAAHYTCDHRPVKRYPECNDESGVRYINVETAQQAKSLVEDELALLESRAEPMFA